MGTGKDNPGTNDSFEEIFFRNPLTGEDVESLAKEIRPVLAQIAALRACPELNDERRAELQTKKQETIRRHLNPRMARNTYFCVATGFVAAELLADSPSEQIWQFFFSFVTHAICVNGLDLWYFMHRTERRLQEMSDDEKKDSNTKK
jgi:hypothetical protein